MSKKFLIKQSFTILFLLLFSSCSYLTPQSSNEYTVTRKSPLIMPPDMNMSPPAGKSLKNKNNIEQRPNNEEKISVEDILTGKVSIKNNKFKNSKKNTYSKKRLVNRILKTKAAKVLE